MCVNEDAITISTCTEFTYAEVEKKVTLLENWLHLSLLSEVF